MSRLAVVKKLWDKYRVVSVGMGGPLILAILTSLTPLPSSIHAARRPLLLLLFKVYRRFSPPSLLFLACPSDTTHTNGECPREQKEADSSQPFFFSDTDSVLRVGWGEVSQEGEIIISLGDDACVCTGACLCRRGS